MRFETLAKSNRFHGHRNGELAFWPNRIVATKLNRHIISQERTVSYRFFLHQHPWVQQLVQRLLRKGTAGLQDADTDYEKKADGSPEVLPDGKFKPTLYADFFKAVYKPVRIGATALPGQRPGLHVKRRHWVQRTTCLSRSDKKPA